ncbi:plasminogen activator, urokinase b [Genypterus blacodes]|uniref:plasminogen activator, urokinase b n=1 Tax=Genypterus blacodes TaxID=154954 RepID=UPI003F76D39B
MMKAESFVVFIYTLSALSTTEAVRVLVRRRRPAFSTFSYRRSGVLCLNGGTSVPSLSRGEHMFCLCPDGFGGKHCETATSADCYEGVGLYYRGTVSQSQSGRPCNEWDLDTRKQYMSTDIKAGRHNYCRNVYFKRRPWCYVWKNLALVQEYCDIPRCASESFPAHPLPTPTVTAALPLLTTTVTAAPESTCGRRSRKQFRIVGGTIATIDSHPWFAAIFWRSKSKEQVFRCGGTLILPCWVLTAAHCFPEGSHTKARRFTVTMGKNALNETIPDQEQTFKVEEIFNHEGFDNSEGNFNNDIALVKLRSKHGQCAQESHQVRTVCLPPPHQTLQADVQCEIAGFGKEKFGLWYKSQYLREARVNLIAQDVCGQRDYYGSLITDNMFCAGSPDWSQDACESDSGGPLVSELDNRLYLFGIVSWGDGCAQEFRPGVYTKVTNYYPWIEEKTGLSLLPQNY